MTRPAKTILVVENEPFILSLCVAILEEMDDIILAANSVEEAIRLSREHEGRVDLLLTDFNLSDEMDGHELSNCLSGFYPDLRTLYMSGFPEQFFIQSNILDTPRAAYLKKPFLTDELLNKVNEQLSAAVNKGETFAV
jgi:CheY-like chemotaxis protein